MKNKQILDSITKSTEGFSYVRDEPYKLRSSSRVTVLVLVTRLGLELHKRKMWFDEWWHKLGMTVNMRTAEITSIRLLQSHAH